MCSKLLPIILLEFPRTFTFYSFVHSVFSEDTLALSNTSFKIVELQTYDMTALLECLSILLEYIDLS